MLGSSSLISRGGSVVHKVVAAPSRQVWIRIGSSTGDNVYKLTVGEPQVATPGVEIVQPIAGTELCDTNNELEAEALYSTFPALAIPDGKIGWLLDSVSLGTGRLPLNLATTQAARR